MQPISIYADLSHDSYPEYLFWVGCAGAADPRYQKVIRAFVKILQHCSIDFGILGEEESCTGDPARRAGNEMLFQMQALQVIETFNRYHIKQIITCCPHCFNTFKNEYPDLGGSYEVVSHVEFIAQLIDQGKLIVDPSVFKDKVVTYHDPCYLGRGNGIYDAPRRALDALGVKRVELKENRSKSLCCGAGGAQLFKENDPGTTEINLQRTDQVLESGAGVVATACPFCMLMLTDGLQTRKANSETITVENKDIAELIAAAL